MVLDSLDAQEAQAILTIIHRKGVEGVISACTKTDTTNKNNIGSNVERALLELPAEEQVRLMALHEAKKGAVPEECEVDDETASYSKRSQAV